MDSHTDMLKAKKSILTKVKKREGEIVSFDEEKIINAVNKAIISVEGDGDIKLAKKISGEVVSVLNKRFGKDKIPGVEDIQDIVEESLIKEGLSRVAKSYILYRKERSQIRETRKLVPKTVRHLVRESKRYFRNPLAEFIYYRTYSRWIDEESRRETWIETVDRYIDFMRENLGKRLEQEEYKEIREAILRQEAMPSMRLMWGAGKAARKTNVTAYNCSYIAPSKLEDFAEIIYLSMCGTGVGFSVESQTVQQLPIIKFQNDGAPTTHVIEDSKEGWGDALTLGLKAWYRGEDIKFDYSKLRPAGARLHTMGGRSSGPEPLRALLDFAREKIFARQGKRLTNLDVHDIICKIGEVVVMGGVRRCLPQNTLIHTKKGLKPIRNIKPGEEILTAKDTYRKVIASKYTGKRQLVNIRTQLGVFQSTPEHRWAVLDDLDGNVRWIEASNLTPNDALVHIPDVIPGRKTSLPPYNYKKPKYSTTTKDIVIPELDEEIAWLVGYFHGDGYVYRKDGTYGEVMFACSPDMPKTVDRAKRNLERFGVNSSISNNRHDNAIRVRVKSNQLANYFSKFKQSKMSMDTPDFILESTPKIRAAYVAGVFDADGSVKSRHGKKVRPIIAASIYPDWLRQLRAVLASLGISAYVKQNRPKKGNWKALYHLTLISIESFASFENLMAGRSEKWRNDSTSMERKKEQNSFVVPRQLLAISPYRSQFESAYYVPSSKVSLSFSKFETEVLRNCSYSVNTEVAVADRPAIFSAIQFSIAPQYYRPVKVRGVEMANRAETYDIQVEGDERFVAEGMLVHNSALISLSDLDDEDMRHAKEGKFYFFEPQRQMANNSAVYNKKPMAAELMEEWLALAKSGTGERGIFNRAGLKHQLPKRRWETFGKYWPTSGTNPCITGDTLVYVADGRGSVSIKKLADERKDVPVFCLDNKSKVAVRYMRNPRLTGKKHPVYKITLDDGSTIKATGNHKFRLKSGDYRETLGLKKGDSLQISTRHEAPVGPHKRKTQDYWWVNNGHFASNVSEHRLIASFYYNQDIPSRYVVHHKDMNAQNNSPQNLVILKKEDHDKLHSELMLGDNNPMRRAAYEWSESKWLKYKEKHSVNNAGSKNKNFSGVTDKELRNHALQLTKNLNRRFSHLEWARYAQKNNLPQYFSKWRRDHLGGIMGMAKWAAQELGLEHIDADPRVMKSYKKYTARGYNCEIIDGRLVVIKNCEVCGKEFRSGKSRREYGICSISCGLKQVWQNPLNKLSIVQAINEAHRKRKQHRRLLQVKIYSDLKFRLQRDPLKREWVTECKANQVTPEISRASSPFRRYSELKGFSSMYNHKVVSVEFCGYEDVYNGTVDEFHNFFVGGFDVRTKKGKRKFVYLNNRNCGEIILRSKSFCNLSEVVCRQEDTRESLLRKVRIATILGTYQSRLTNFQYLSRAWRKNCEEERLLGVSLTGQWDCDEVRNPETLKALRDYAIFVNKEYAKRFGINESTCITCVKPSGTVSQLVDASSGMHTRHSKYYIRRIRISASDPLFHMLKDQKFPCFPEVGQPINSASTYVLEFPVKSPEGSITRDRVPAIDQLEYWKMVKKNYTEHNPSVTISIGDDEWIETANWLYKYWDILGGLSFLPKSDHAYSLAPYEAISEEKYNEMVSKLPEVDFSQILAYEKEDSTQGAKELACVAGVCEIEEVTTGASH